MNPDAPDDANLETLLSDSESSDALAWLSQVELQGRVTPPSPDLKQRLLETLDHGGRFERFSLATAQLLDLPQEQAQRLLDQVDDPAVWGPGLMPGMALFHVQGGPAVREAITGFVRMEAGVVHPEHEHFGEESVLLLQGSCIDEGRILRPGDRVVMPAGSQHSFTVRPGPDLLYLAVVHKGFRMGELALYPGDPRA